MDAKSIWTIVRKSPTWKPEDLQTLDELKQFCVDKRRVLNAGNQPDTNLAYIWANVAHAVWGAMRERGGSVPREPSLHSVIDDPSLAVRTLDGVIQWCDIEGGLVKGVSLRDAAKVIRSGDTRGQTELIKSWRNSRKPILPAPIGKCPNHSQTDLFKPAALLAFLKEFEGAKVDTDFPLRAAFRDTSRTPV